MRTFLLSPSSSDIFQCKPVFNYVELARSAAIVAQVFIIIHSYWYLRRLPAHGIKSRILLKCPRRYLWNLKFQQFVAFVSPSISWVSLKNFIQFGQVVWKYIYIFIKINISLSTKTHSYFGQWTAEYCSTYLKLSLAKSFNI